MRQRARIAFALFVVAVHGAPPGRVHAGAGGEVNHEVFHFSQYKEIHIVPAPGGVRIDGRLDDWDLSGALPVRMDDLKPVRHGVTAAMMYDREYLYVAAQVRDPTPMMNVHGDGYSAWHGDHLAVRLIAAPAPKAYNRFDKEQRSHAMYLDFWYETPTNKARSFITRCEARNREMDPAGVEGAFQKSEDGAGYTLEYRVPWSVIKPAREFADGDQVRVMWQMHWGDRDGRELLFGVTFPQHPEWLSPEPMLYDVYESWGTGVFGKPAAPYGKPAATRTYSEAIRRELQPRALARPEPEANGTNTVWRLTPEMDLQSAADRAGPGHVLQLAPGIYRQSLFLRKGGAAGAPLVIRAAEGGTATLSGAAVGLKLDFERMRNGIGYRSAVPWPVFWVRANGRNLVNSGTISNFCAGGTVPNEGFCMDEEGYLCIRLKGIDPANANVEIQGNTECYYNIEIDGANDVTIEGLRLEMAPYAGVVLRNCRDITIRDCYIAGCSRGIRSDGNARSVTVEHCEFSNYPQAQWVRGANLWGALYESLQSGSFIKGGGHGWRVRHNFAYECWDTIQIHAPEWAGEKVAEQEYAYNLIMNSADDGFEIDWALPRDWPSRIRIHHNVIVDAWDAFSLAPHAGGKLLLDHNLVYDSPEYGRGVWNLTFKLAQSTPYLGDVAVVHNTIVNRRLRVFGPVTSMTNIENFVFLNNLIEEVEKIGGGGLDRVGMTVDPHNFYCWRGGAPDAAADAGDLPRHAGGRQPYSYPALTAAMPGLNRYGREAGFISDPGKVAWAYFGDAPAFADCRVGGNAPRVQKGQLNFHLAANSLAVDGGTPTDLCEHKALGAAPDLGAIEMGTRWEFPTPGPRWANFTNCPYRPPLPPSLDPRMVGLVKADESDSSWYRSDPEPLMVAPAVPEEVATLAKPPALRAPQPPADDGKRRIWTVSPDTDLQQVADRVRPGDVVEMEPGAYCQSVTFKRGGNADAPVTVRAREPGSVTLTGAVSPTAWKFQPYDKTSYRTAVPLTVQAAAADGRMVWRNKDLVDFRMGVGLGDGFYQEGGWLYLRLRNDGDPGKARIEVLGPRAPGTNVRIDGAEYLALENLRFAMAPDTAVLIAKGGNIAVRDCHFSGCRVGIGCADGVRASNVVVERCEYSGYPFYQWHRGDRYYWDLLGAPEHERVFLSGGGTGWVIRNNFIHECAVGVKLLEGGGSAPDDRQVIERNLIMNCVEAGILAANAEGASVNTRLHGNLIVDARHALTLGKGQGLEIDRNIVYTSPYNGVGQDAYQLKFLGKDAGGTRIVQNTFVNRRGSPADRDSWPATGVLFENNIFDFMPDAKTPVIKVISNNLFRVNRADSRGPMNTEQPVFASEPSLSCPALGAGEPFFFLDPVGARPIQRAGQIGFYLAPVSNAISAATAGADGKTPDMGAIERGRRWDFPPPGPRWASFDNVPNRPPLPIELDPHFAGLAPDAAPPLSNAPAAAAVAMEGFAVTRPLDAQGIAVAAFVKRKRAGGNARATETVQGVSLVTADVDMPGFADSGQALWEVRIAEMFEGKPFPETRVLVHPGTKQAKFTDIRGAHQYQ